MTCLISGAPPTRSCVPLSPPEQSPPRSTTLAHRTDLTLHVQGQGEDTTVHVLLQVRPSGVWATLKRQKIARFHRDERSSPRFAAGKVDCVLNSAIIRIMLMK
ncbi:hypothetical protein BaRGS_00006677, partial [Batillaria attramentaria]